MPGAPLPIPDGELRALTAAQITRDAAESEEARAALFFAAIDPTFNSAARLVLVRPTGKETL